MEGQFSNPKASEKEGEGPKRFSRRAFLGAGATLIGAVGTGLYFLENQKDEAGGTKEDDSTPEKVNELNLAREKIHAQVEKMKRLPFMEKPLRARKQIGQVEAHPNFSSVVVGVEDQGESTALHIQDVQALSRSVSLARGKGVYVHREYGNRYHLTLEDTPVDIGVSNRFNIRRHDTEGKFIESLPVYAVKRSRYENKEVVNEVPKKKDGRKTVREFEGNYVEYVTYTPPASQLVSQEVIGSGKEYVGVVLEAAFSVLSERMTAENKKALAMCRDICKRLAVVEHIDPILLTLAEKKQGNETEDQMALRTKKLYQKMYAEYGLNQDVAFNYLINPLGAGGMMQIMTRTYTDIRIRLLEGKFFSANEIPENPNVGRKDPLTSAIIAIYLCYDNFRLQKTFFSGRNDDEVELSLVTMYNGSPNLFKKILKVEDSKKTKAKTNIKEVPKPSPAILRAMTTPFLKKLLTHNEGRKLPGSGEPENRNYLRKYILLKSFEKDL